MASKIEQNAEDIGPDKVIKVNLDAEVQSQRNYFPNSYSELNNRKIDMDTDKEEIQALEQKIISEGDESSSPVTFDSILNRIGLGFYHLKVWIIFGFLGCADGSESMVLSFTIPIFKKVFNPGYGIEAALGTWVYIGFFIGSLLSGFASDKFGRRTPVIYSTFLMIVFCLLSAWPPSITVFIIYRTIFGMIDGFFSPLAYTYMAEVTPAKNRGKYMAMLAINYSFGEIIACLIAIITLDDLSSGNWHALLAWATFPAILAFLSATFFLRESPRYQMVNGKYEQGIKNLNLIYKDNKKTDQPLMTESEKEELIQSYEETKRKSQEKEDETQVATINDLFAGKYAKITIPVWFNWFTNSLTFYGITYILPTVLDELNQGNNNNNNDDDFTVSSVIWSAIGELPTTFIVAAIVDLKGFGRKNSMAYSFLLGAATCLLASIQCPPGLVFWISISKFFFNLAWTLNFQFTSELYPTKIRGKGIGLASSFGRIGSIIMPTICTALNAIGPLVPFAMFGITAAISGVLTLMMPYDTADLQIDVLDMNF